MTHVFDAILHHNQAFYATTPGKASIFFGVYVGLAQHIRVNHTAAKQLNPARLRTDRTARFVTKRTAERKLKAWFCEREIKRLGLDLKLFAIVFLQKCFERGNQVAGMDLLADIHPFELVKSVLMASIKVFIAKDPTWNDGGDRLALLQEVAIRL